jgi:hypothetical protein
MTSWKGKSVARKWRLAAVCAAVAYLGCWAATNRLGVPAVIAAVGSHYPGYSITAASPCPFVLSVTCTPELPSSFGFTATHLWLVGTTHELSRKGSSPFINTLF